MDDVFGQFVFAPGDEDLLADDAVLPGMGPSSIGVAVVRSAPTSEPACGSVRFIVPDHSPLTTRGR